MIQTELDFGRSEETGLIRKNLSHLSNLLTNIFTINMNKRNIFIVSTVHLVPNHLQLWFSLVES